MKMNAPNWLGDFLKASGNDRLAVMSSQFAHTNKLNTPMN
jgi:hypothetical protein